MFKLQNQWCLASYSFESSIPLNFIPLSSVIPLSLYSFLVYYPWSCSLGALISNCSYGLCFPPVWLSRRCDWCSVAGSEPDMLVIEYACTNWQPKWKRSEFCLCVSSMLGMLILVLISYLATRFHKTCRSSGLCWFVKLGFYLVSLKVTGEGYWQANNVLTNLISSETRLTNLIPEYTHF